VSDDTRPLAKIYREIWRDPEFTALDQGPQHLFFLLLTQPNVTLKDQIRERPTPPRHPRFTAVHDYRYDFPV
jgi:hypothetical protein